MIYYESLFFQHLCSVYVGVDGDRINCYEDFLHSIACTDLTETLGCVEIWAFSHLAANDHIDFKYNLLYEIKE